MSKGKLRFLKYLFLTLAYVCLFLPLFIICIVYREEFFHKNVEGFTVGMGGILAVVYFAVLFKVGFKKIHPTVTCGVLILISYCLQTILNRAVVLSIGLFVGVAVYSILMIPEKYFAKMLETYIDEEVREGVRTRRDRRVRVELENDSGRC